MPLQPAVYLLASQRNGTLYIGGTRDLVRRAYEHRHSLVQGFTQRYGVHCLVYYELHDSMLEAITREKRLKKWRREWNLELIESFNPDWRDLWDEII
ncbi:GIY-YIG nuclease family protein [Pseudomonas sp. SCB32]|uniref:GIY-YIG nuclease family protein n=1 Tax=Pseudomonas sp. SCB32 TaxID=2653853 RepID=UPI001C49A555|nr:GIY-YIG nuclease family protein [Pseudomonas sp. SCB32]